MLYQRLAVKTYQLLFKRCWAKLPNKLIIEQYILYFLLKNVSLFFISAVNKGHISKPIWGLWKSENLISLDQRFSCFHFQEGGWMLSTFLDPGQCQQMRRSEGQEGRCHPRRPESNPSPECGIFPSLIWTDWKFGSEKEDVGWSAPFRFNADSRVLYFHPLCHRVSLMLDTSKNCCFGKVFCIGAFVKSGTACFMDSGFVLRSHQSVSFSFEDAVVMHWIKIYFICLVFVGIKRKREGERKKEN